MLTQRLPENSIFDCDSDSNLFQYRLIAEKLQSDLIKFGLTTNQVKVFLFLSKYGEQTASEISKSVNLPRTETYHILSALQNKGIIVSKLCHPTVFSSLSIGDAITVLIDSEKNRITHLENNSSKLIQQWAKVPTFDKADVSNAEKLQMLQGNNVIFAKLTKLLESSKKSIKIFFNEKDLSRFYNEEIFEHISVVSKPKFLISTKNKKSKICNELKNIQYRYFKNNNFSNQCFMIVDSSKILYFMKNTQFSKSKTFAFFTTSESLIQSLELLFDSIWHQDIRIHDSESFSKINNSPFLGISKFEKIMSELDNIEIDSKPFPQLIENI